MKTGKLCPVINRMKFPMPITGDYRFGYCGAAANDCIDPNVAFATPEEFGQRCHRAVSPPPPGMTSSSSHLTML
jgi:hypothetical protein